MDAESDLTVGATIGNAIGGVDDPPPPPVIGLNTVICVATLGGTSAIRMSAAGTTAVSCCAALLNVVGNVVVLIPLFHCTTEHGKKLLPERLTVSAAVPAVAWAGISVPGAIDGNRSTPDAATEKILLFETSELLVTETMSVDGFAEGKAASAGVSNAVSCIELTKVVTRGEPFQLTTELLTKFVPVTTSVTPEGLQAAAEELVTAEIAGGEIANATLPDDAPPGTRFVTWMFAVPEAAKSVDGIVMLSEAAPPAVAIYVVGNAVVTFLLSTHCATEHGRILPPVTVNVSAEAPTAAEVCERVGVPGVPSAAVTMVNGRPLEVPGKDVAASLKTETVAVPGNAVSVAEIKAVS